MNLEYCEIPVTDYERASKFYTMVFKTTISHVEGFGYHYGHFNMDLGNRCSIVCGDGYVPSGTATTIYFGIKEDIQSVADRAIQNQATLVFPKTYVEQMGGYACVFTDSEGNRIGLYQR